MNNVIAIDTETYLIGQPDIIPKLICMQTYDGKNFAIYTADETPGAFLNLLIDYEEIVIHNSSFDLCVLVKSYPQLLIPIVENIHKFRDTMIREQLYDISTIGYVKSRGYSLSGLISAKLGIDISSWKGGDSVRMRYSEVDGLPVAEWPEDFVTYAHMDVNLTYRLYMNQIARQKDRGYGSINSETLQIQTAMAFGLMTEEGIAIDTAYAQEVFQPEMDAYQQSLEQLVELGYASITKTGKIRQHKKEIQEHLESMPEVKEHLRYTEPTKTYPNGQVELGAEALASYPRVPIVKALLDISELHKNCTTYFPKMIGNERVYPQYQVLVSSGRPSSRESGLYPSVNICNQPRDGGVRECFVADEGKILLVADYAQAELCMGAQILADGGFGTELLDLINEGYDIHSWFGAKIKGVPYAEFVSKKKEKEYDEIRQCAKKTTLGVLGGKGHNRILAELLEIGIKNATERMAKNLKDLLFEFIPCIGKGTQHITNVFGYGSTECTYESYENFFRNRCRFTEASNGKFMQTPTAMAAKRAVWEIFLATSVDKNSVLYGSQLKWFIYDEIAIQTEPVQLKEKAQELGKLCLQAMRHYAPDVKMSMDIGAMKRWSKQELHIEEEWEVSL